MAAAGRLGIAIAGGLATAAARPALAGDDETYRGTMAIVDVASAALLVGAAAGEAPAALFLGLGGYGLGSPIVHAAHGRWGPAALALGARVGLPALTAVIGCGVGQSGQRGRIGGALGCMGGGMMGAAVGVVAGLVIDYAVLASVDADPTPVMLSFGASF